MYETLEILRDGGVATIWMNRPDVHNAFNEQLIAELTAACQALDADDGARGGARRPRQELLGRRRPQLDAPRRRCLGRGQPRRRPQARRHAAHLAEMNKPTIARVHGAALGGGMGLASACDICVAGEGAVFATSEVRFGIIPSAISPYVIRAIGARQATATSRPPSGSPPPAELGWPTRWRRRTRSTPRCRDRHRPAAGRPKSAGRAKD
jgi:methylglutaconyl-CoA hydratase